MPTTSLTELAERLRIARKAAGLSQEEVASRSGMLQPTVSAIEAGKRNVDSLELAKFAELYNKPLHYFLDSSFSDESETFSPLLKSQEILDSDRAVLDDFRVFCQDYAELEQHVAGKVNVVRVFEDLVVPKTRRDAIEQGVQYASALRNIFGLGIEPTYDVRLFLDTIGIKAIKRKLSTPNVTGVYVYSPDYGHCLLVNRSGNRQLDRFSLAHTFCHALLDWPMMDAKSNFVVCSNWLNDTLVEYRASVFAVNFLMPHEAVEKLWLQMRTQAQPSVFDTIAIARYFGVDYESTLHRFVLMNLISEKERTSLQVELSQSALEIDELLGYKASEVRVSGEELYPDRYIKLGFEAFEQGKISVGRLAKFLGKNIYETNLLIQRLKLRSLNSQVGNL
ncbi:MAG: XRE family transcriptional regulator [Ignavibacteriales bacterium]|nr:XRE family transcriptional regulator [Ignavibacteriales bacterium]